MYYLLHLKVGSHEVALVNVHLKPVGSINKDLISEERLQFSEFVTALNHQLPGM